MRALRPFVPPLAAMLLAAGQASAQGVLIDRSEIRFVSRQLGSSVEGRFRKWRANVDFRPRELARSKADLEIELGSVDLASEETETEVKRPRWFDVAQFPVARFASTAIRETGVDRYEIAGQLSIKGTTRDVVVPVTLRRDVSGNSIADGQFTLRRLDFRLGDGQWADTDTVANDVVVRVRMVLPAVK